MPGAQRTRSLACDKNKAHERSHHRYSRDHPAFPHAMVLRLISRSPRRRIRLVTVIGGLRFCRTRAGRLASADLPPATGARTTRLCRTQTEPFVSVPLFAHETPPRDTVTRPTLPRPPHPAPRP